ncbi:MAG: SBBP repeat-containing protein [Dehalococcoidia bacterium]
MDFLAHGSGYSLALSGGEASVALRAGRGERALQPPVRPDGLGLPSPLAGEGPGMRENAPADEPAKPGAISQSDDALVNAAPDEHATDPTEMPILRLLLPGASLSHGIGEDLLPGAVNYFIGSDPQQWHTDIRTYSKVRYPNVYPGIDLVYYGNQGQLEYDFIVSPGADPEQIALAYAGANSLHLDEQGSLLVALDSDESRSTPALRQAKPTIYQQVDGLRRIVDGGYRLEGASVQFELARYDASLPLVIDPTLVYSTYLGGDLGLDDAVAVDGSGSAYIIGETFNATTSNIPACPGSDSRCASAGAALQASPRGAGDAYMAKLSADGTHLLYSTYLGGSGMDDGAGIAVDSEGNAFVTGNTTSSDFPTTANALQRTFPTNGTSTAYLAKLSPDGTNLLYSTYLGGGVEDTEAIALDRSGNVYLTGETSSKNFPTCPGSDPRCASIGSALQTTLKSDANAYVAKLSADGGHLLYSTFLGGSGEDRGEGIAVDTGGNAYLVGQTTSTDFPTCPGSDSRCAGPGTALQPAAGGARFDAFVAKLSPDGTKLLYSTYLGGSGSDQGFGIAVGMAGNAYVSGITASPNFPTCPGPDSRCVRPGTALKASLGSAAANAFVAELSVDGTRLLYSTFLGGSGTDVSYAIAVDARGFAYVTGAASSTDFPTTANAVQRSYGGGIADAFVTKLDATGTTLLYSTYLGGSSQDFGFGIAVDGSGNAYLVGQVWSSDFPLCPGPEPLCTGPGNPLQAGTAAPPATFVAKIMTGLRGDVNQSGRVDTVDALCILRQVAGLAITNACPLISVGQSDPIWHVSLNSGSTINAVDALCVLRSVAGLGTTSVCPILPLSSVARALPLLGPASR